MHDAQQAEDRVRERGLLTVPNEVWQPSGGLRWSGRWRRRRVWVWVRWMRRLRSWAFRGDRCDLVGSQRTV